MYTVPKLDDYSPEALDRAVADLFAALDSETSALQNETDWKTFRDRWLARKNGVLTQVNDTWLKAAPGPAKREVGQRVNQLKARAEAAIEEAQTKLLASVPLEARPPSVWTSRSLASSAPSASSTRCCA